MEQITDMSLFFISHSRRRWSNKLCYFVHWDANFHIDQSRHTVLCRGDKREFFGHTVLIVPVLWSELLLRVSFYFSKMC